MHRHNMAHRNRKNNNSQPAFNDCLNPDSEPVDSQWAQQGINKRYYFLGVHIVFITGV